MGGVRIHQEERERGKIEGRSFRFESQKEIKIREIGIGFVL